MKITEDFITSYHDFLIQLTERIKLYNTYKYLMLPERLSESVINIDDTSIIIRIPYAPCEYGTDAVEFDTVILPLSVFNSDNPNQEIKDILQREKKAEQERLKQLKKQQTLINKNEALAKLSQLENEAEKIRKKYKIGTK